jgi:hypothetical protein
LLKVACWLDSVEQNPAKKGLKGAKMKRELAEKRLKGKKSQPVELNQ